MRGKEFRTMERLRASAAACEGYEVRRGTERKLCACIVVKHSYDLRKNCVGGEPSLIFAKVDCFRSVGDSAEEDGKLGQVDEYFIVSRVRCSIDMPVTFCLNLIRPYFLARSFWCSFSFRVLAVFFSLPIRIITVVQKKRKFCDLHGGAGVFSQVEKRLDFADLVPIALRRLGGECGYIGAQYFYREAYRECRAIVTVAVAQYRD
ncbi:hypothetical protein CPB83DRAFT_838305 [Crepidotus variabilis]|uniref:Uncharacterized protein n=1 Tax=Crepidotus variabilis TaxID=179855 RepID=A0A9P6E9X7_9AGAR|nr:hypothetical protein CPB83DRAFT_838305 [Crepidotus variabilis]